MNVVIVSIVNPRWSNKENTSVDVDVEFSHLNGSIDPFTALDNSGEGHTQYIWDYVIAGNAGEIAPYIDPEPEPEPIPNEISRRQFFQQLSVLDIITRTEAMAALQDGTIPSPLMSIIDSLPTEDDKFNAQMLIVGAQTFNRTHPLAEIVRQAMQWTIEQKDNFWFEAFKL